MTVLSHHGLGLTLKASAASVPRGGRSDEKALHLRRGSVPSGHGIGLTPGTPSGEAS